MATSIRGFASSTDTEKIKTVKKWIQMTKVKHKDRLLCPIYTPQNLQLTPDEISAYASAINTILPDEKVTDYNHIGFVTVKKEAFPKVCFNNDFDAPHYFMELDDLGWHIIPQKDLKD